MARRGITWRRGGTSVLGASLLVVLVLAAGCTSDEEPEVVDTPTPRASSTPRATGTATSTATSTATPKGTATGTATAAPTAPPDGTPSVSEPPPGYAQSCAREHPWGEQVSQPFVCLESAANRVEQPKFLDVFGYAGGAFENNVVIEVFEVTSANTLGNLLAREALVYRAPDVGMPGRVFATLVLPDDFPRGPARVVAYFDSPRDGSRVAEGTLSLTLR